MSGRPAETLTIERLAFGGEGVARYPQGHPQTGKVVLVRGGLPGEVVEARLDQSKKDFDRAEVVKVIAPSAERVAPACSVFGRCGGCQLQHLTYPHQLRAKAGWLREALLRAGLGEAVPAEIPIRPSPWEWRYRFRARFQVSAQGEVGFQAARSHRVVAFEDCPVLTEPLAGLRLRLAQALSLRPPGEPLEMEAGADEAGAAFVLASSGRGRLRPQARASLIEAGRISGAAVHLDRVKVEPDPTTPPAGSLRLTISGREFSLFPGVFGQAQAPQNEALVDSVLQAAQVEKGDQVLDLMAGAGNFGLPLASAGAGVTAVEIDPISCANGRFNARQAGLQVEFLNLEAGAALSSFLEAGRRFRTVVVDPPRQGIKDLIEPLVALAPRRILYVSCHPATLARDLNLLTGRGYLLERILAVDMFPQTFHLESLTSLRAERP